MAGKKFDVAQDVTNKILEMMETHGSNWKKPWQSVAGSYPVNVQTSKFYNGINIFMLWSAQMQNNFKHGIWGTYRQWEAVGGEVIPGSKSVAYVTFWTTFEKETVNKKGDTVKKNIPYLKYSPVFNMDQVQGYTGKWSKVETVIRNTDERNKEIDKWIKGTGATITYGRDGACYIPSYDLIEMPAFDQFNSADTYYSTHIHELTHWTGSKKRLDRDLKNAFGSEGYAFEELVAELGAAMGCAMFGLNDEPREDHVKYLNNWIKVLKDDKKAIIKAASLAQKAIDYMNDLQVEEQPKEQAA